MRQLRDANRSRLDTWLLVRIEKVDPRGRFDSFAVTAQLYTDYLRWVDQQSEGVWVPVHRRTFDVFVKTLTEVRRGRTIGWALRVLTCIPTVAIKATSDNE